MTGWWFTPQIHLCRKYKRKYVSLEEALKERAEMGVLVFIVMYPLCFVLAFRPQNLRYSLRV